MPIKDIFKKQSAEPEKKETKKKEVKKEVQGKIVSKYPNSGKKVISYGVLKLPRITEKSTDLAEKNKYVFEVFEKTNKIEIKKTIESLYKVDVMNVRIINIHRKRKRLGRHLGWQKGYKKAIVKIKEGQTIEILSK